MKISTYGPVNCIRYITSRWRHFIVPLLMYSGCSNPIYLTALLEYFGLSVSVNLPPNTVKASTCSTKEEQFMTYVLVPHIRKLHTNLQSYPLHQLQAVVKLCLVRGPVETRAELCELVSIQIGRSLSIVSTSNISLSKLQLISFAKLSYFNGRMSNTACITNANPQSVTLLLTSRSCTSAWQVHVWWRGVVKSKFLSKITSSGRWKLKEQDNHVCTK